MDNPVLTQGHEVLVENIRFWFRGVREMITFLDSLTTGIRDEKKVSWIWDDMLRWDSAMFTTEGDTNGGKAGKQVTKCQCVCFCYTETANQTSVSLGAVSCQSSIIFIGCLSGRRSVAIILQRQTHPINAIKHIGESSSHHEPHS